MTDNNARSTKTLHISSVLPPLLSSGDSSATFCLDFVPYLQFDVCVRKFIKSLHCGQSATITFSALAPHIRFLSKNFILSAVPFMPRTYLDDADSDPADVRRFERAYTPLFVSLTRLTELLCSTSPQITIKCVEQVSDEYSQSLLTLERMLLQDKIVRDVLIRRWSLSGWREHRLMLAWEAGLFSSGLLHRWKVVIDK
ncbi:hypothetical protein K435DRAFT_729781, partial [Dendrothele bispora CBS 962.96]